jgi:signal transduction histidine kinase
MPEILLVDDAPVNLDLMERLLRPLGYAMRRATSGREALELFAHAPADLVLVDLVMPDFDGIEVLSRLRASESGRDVPVIVVTGSMEHSLRVRGLEAGADEFLEKPIDSAVLLARVRTLLRLKESRDDLRRSRDALRAQNAALEAVHRDQRELTEFIVHDLKNLLGVTWINLHFIDSRISGSGSPVKEALEDAIEASGRLRDMIDDLLVVSRLEQSEFPLTLGDVALQPMVEEAVVRHARHASERQVTISPPLPPGIELRADSTLLRRVLDNLLDNALRYTPPEGRIAVEAEQDDDVIISVRNSGTPIPVADRHRIFDKFARGHGEATARGNAGIGLYFCKRAIEAHGGAISVVEDAEWPTSFVIRLPTGGRYAA